MSEKIYACLLRLYPSAFRSKYREEALQLYRDHLEDEACILLRFRLHYDLLVDVLFGLPLAWRNTYTASALSFVAENVPCFRLLEEQPLRPASIIIGSTLTLALLSAFGFIMGLPVPSRSSSISNRLSAIELVMERLNHAVSPDIAGQLTTATTSAPARTQDRQSGVSKPVEIDTGDGARPHKQRRINMSGSKRQLLVTMGILAATVPVGLGRGQTPNGQGWEKAAGGAMKFEVASVRLNPGPMEPANFRLSPDDAYTNTGGLLNADFPLATYIEFAYKIQPRGPEQFEAMYAHLPKWVRTDNYEIHARAAEQNPTKDEMRLMMQALLTKRFGLVVHYETRDTPVFEMSLARPGNLGPKLRHHEEGPACSVTAPPGTRILGTPAHGGVGLKGPDVFPATCGGIEARIEPHQMMLMGARDTTMEMIASSLSVGRLGRPVVDQTGLTGKYDFSLNWAREPGAFGTGPGTASQDAPTSDSQGPTFLDAVGNQLGLRIKPGKAPLKVLVIDHVERPSPN